MRFAHSATGYLLDDSVNNSYAVLFGLLKADVKSYRLTSGPYSKGTIYVPGGPSVDAKLAPLVTAYPVTLKAAPAGMAGAAMTVTLPRIGLYQSWVPSMDEGWTRWMFDTNGIPYQRLVDADIRKGGLKDHFDVIVLPDAPAGAILRGAGERREGSDEPPTPPDFRGGLGADGFASLNAFVEAGGTVVALNKASQVYAKKGCAGRQCARRRRVQRLLRAWLHPRGQR